MDRLLPALIIAAFLALVLGLMWWGWHRRQQRQRALPRLASVSLKGGPLDGGPTDAGAELTTVHALYVATTVAEEPLERIAVGGLGYRAKAQLTVREKGLILEIPGQDGLFIPATDIVEVFRAQNTIDRVVERDGLIGLRYRIVRDDATLIVDSYVRIVDPVVANEFVAVVSALVASSGVTSIGSSSVGSSSAGSSKAGAK